MKYIFTDEDIKNEINIINIPEDDLVLFGETLSGEGKSYIISGRANIEGETYHGFEIEFELVKEALTPRDIMDTDWEWYDYII